MVDEIPDFRSSQYEGLVHDLTAGACIFFGAGISKLAGYKLWEELRDKIISCFWEYKIQTDNKMRIDYSTCRALRKHPDIVEAFDYLYSINRQLFVTIVNQIFHDDEISSSNCIYEALNRFNNGSNFFVTTNIDRGLQRYMGATDDDISIYPKFSNPAKLITYVHGRIDKEETWIFTGKKYEDGYKYPHSSCTEFLTRTFEKNVVLFLGYGLREPEIMKAISFTSKHKVHWWFEAWFRGNSEYLKIRATTFHERYNIQLVPYSIENEGHGILVNVLRALQDALRRA